MAKTFDQAITDDSAFGFFSARNSKVDELEALIAQIGDLKIKAVNTRSTRDKYDRIRSRSDVLVTKLRDENEAMCTALFQLNTKMVNDPKFK